MKDEKAGGSAETVFRESPGFIKGGEMRDYQVAGLNWLISLHENGISGILADEMGLGKTLQTISFLGYLRHIMGITGPHLITVPKSTLDNWKREFAKWTPEVNVLVLQGAKDERHSLINERLIDEKFDVCITSYEMILREKAHLKKFAWEYIIIDELWPVRAPPKVVALKSKVPPQAPETDALSEMNHNFPSSQYPSTTSVSRGWYATNATEKVPPILAKFFEVPQGRQRSVPPPIRV